MGSNSRKKAEGCVAYQDLRHFIDLLEKEGELLRVPMEVDWKYEVSGWIRKSVDMRPKGPALLFENIKGYPRGQLSQVRPGPWLT
jgi:UbiD family decarboxylase